jgi:predicted nucleic acid-binding protein
VIVVDTTVLVYAVGADHALKEPSMRLLGAVEAGSVVATTTVEVIQEFVNVRARRRERADAVALARDFTTLLSPLLSVGQTDLERGLTLFERHAGLGSFDAVLAAAAVAAQADALVTSDAAFAAVPRLRYVGLGTPAFERMLAA